MKDVDSDIGYEDNSQVGGKMGNGKEEAIMVMKNGNGIRRWR